jgi:hypothetical protein
VNALRLPAFGKGARRIKCNEFSLARRAGARRPSFFSQILRARADVNYYFWAATWRLVIASLQAASTSTNSFVEGRDSDLRAALAFPAHQPA